MAKAKKGTARPTRKSSSTRSKKIETKIIEAAGLSPHPYCELPSHFFDCAGLIHSPSTNKTVLTVDTWDGRSVFSIDSKIGSK
jgi:hypothetical protein